MMSSLGVEDSNIEFFWKKELIEDNRVEDFKTYSLFLKIIDLFLFFFK